MKYFYLVNTFARNMEPIQVTGTIEGSSEEDVINKLIERGIVYSKGYEFLELKKLGEICDCNSNEDAKVTR